MKYSDKVMDCFVEPKHFGRVKDCSAKGFTGSFECGDAMELTLKISENGSITDAKYLAFGCTAAIASAEALVELIIGKKVVEAEKIKNQDIVDYLRGLPDLKLHCSVLGEAVLKDALEDYNKRKNIDSRGLNKS